MNWITLIGLVAAICTTLSFVPQIIKAHKSKSTKDISLRMYLLMTTGIFLWLVYGIFLKDSPLILANAVGIILTGSMLAMKLNHG